MDRATVGHGEDGAAAMSADGMAVSKGLRDRPAVRAVAQAPRRSPVRAARHGTLRSIADDRRPDSAQSRAGVLAHDFNNLLGVILAANEALAAQMAEGSDAWELARVAQEAAEKGADLLARLVDLTQPEIDDGVIDAAEVVVTTSRLAQVATASSITVVALAMAEPLACRADRTGLESALLNLCINAGHAMPDGGAVQIATKAASVRGAPYVAFSVIDRGIGMSPEVLARATDPFFTTRAGRGGTGLGLSGVRAFAERAGGALKLVSAPGRGTIATLYLPRA